MKKLMLVSLLVLGIVSACYAQTSGTRKWRLEAVSTCIASSGQIPGTREWKYGQCQVQVPKDCGKSTVNFLDPVQVAAFQACTQPKYKACYDQYRA